jgi:hypothetical protein
MPHEEIKSDLEAAAERVLQAVAVFQREARDAITAAQEEVGDYLLVNYDPAPESLLSALPSPRIQLRWEHAEDGGCFCHYELVFPLEKGDVRNDGGAGHCVVALNRGYKSSPYKAETDGSIRVPWRDGVHANLDARHLGNPPIFAIDPTGRYERIEV